MYQSFSNSSDKSQVAQHIAELRQIMSEIGIDGYIIPHGDEFGNEYLPECFKRLEFMTAFSGSWGLAVILEDKAFLCVDSRYQIQAPQETDTEVFECICISDTPLNEFFKAEIFKNLKIGYDSALHTQAGFERLEKYLKDSELIEINHNLIDQLPSKKEGMDLPKTQIIIHPLEYAGKSVTEKLHQIAQTLDDNNTDSTIITLPESLCWLLNLRANDVPHTPYILSYGIFHRTGSLDWFVGKDRIGQEIKEYLPDNVYIHNLNDFYPALSDLSGTVMLDHAHSAAKIYNSLKINQHITKILDKDDPCLLPKAIKNSTEVQATTNAHIRDGAAVTRFACWLAEHSHTDITEIDCVKKLEQYRQETGALQEISFDTIAGTGAHGAIVHYRVSEKTNAVLKAGDLFLLDSGGQYLDGTTDVTRTFAIGEPTDEMRLRYTQVLKGHLAVAMAVFPEKTTGAALDSLARLPLWQAGIDFGHGTGHGVGLYLSVHEGPQSISSRSTIPLKTGMILSNEPGYYKEGAFGIRIENLEVVTEPKEIAGGEKPMMGFKTLTMVPYERKLIDKSMLSEDEVLHINSYHQEILQKIMPFMKNGTEQAFLGNVCKAL